MDFYDIDTHYFPEDCYKDLPEPYKSLAPQFNWKTYTEKPEWWSRIIEADNNRDNAFDIKANKWDWQKPLVCDDKGYHDIDIFPGGKARFLPSVKEGLERGLANDIVYGGPWRGDLNYNFLSARNLNERAKVLDSLGIEKGIIKPYNYMLGLNYRIDIELAMEMAKSYNKTVLRDTKNNKRFWPLIWIPAQNRNTKQVIQLIEDGLSNGAVGINIGEHFSYAEHTLGRPWGMCDWMEPIWNHANKYQYPIFLHVLDCFYDTDWYKWRDKNDKKYVDQWHSDHRHLIDLIYADFKLPKGNKGNLTGVKGRDLSWASFITEGVLDRNPDLKLTLCECGINWVLPLVDHLSKFMKKDCIPYLKNWTFTIEPEAENFEKDANQLGYDRLLFATDYPHMDPGGKNFKNDVNTVLNLNTNTLNKEKIANLNAKRIFKNTAFC
jgi:predicted TIM-barrel fold metal-dependent hydrolase